MHISSSPSPNKSYLSKWEWGTASSRLGEQCGDSSICTSCHPSASLHLPGPCLPTSRGYKCSKKALFSSQAICWRCSLWFIQPKQWEFHILTGSARLSPSCTAASPPSKTLQPNPIALHTLLASPPAGAVSWHIPTAPIPAHIPPKSPGEAGQGAAPSRCLPGERGCRTRLGMSDERWHRSPTPGSGSPRCAGGSFHS